jgi:transposase
MSHYLRSSLGMPNIYLYRAAVDFRKQSNGLTAIVEREPGHNPFDGGLYVFINRQRNRIKMLMWENNGFVLYYKALAEDKFLWPDAQETTISLTGQQINFCKRSKVRMALWFVNSMAMNIFLNTALANLAHSIKLRFITM